MTAAKIYRPDGSVYVPAYKATPRPSFAPFDFINGERMGGLGDDYVVVPAVRWADTPVLDIAMARTKQAMAGYRLSDVQAEILIQEYYSQDLLLVLIAVWGKAPGRATWQWHYVATPIDIKGATKVDLVLAGRWKAQTKH